MNNLTVSEVRQTVEVTQSQTTVSVSSPGPQGARGPQGYSGGSLGEIVAQAAMSAGTPVYISRTNGQILPADAASYVSSFVAGLTVEAVSLGFAVGVSRDIVTLSDWTSVTGSPQLLPGQTYFLAAGGGLTSTPPAKPIAAAVTVVGIAVSATALDVCPSLPILL